MNQQKTGTLLKELRKQKQLTQAQFAEILGVSNRTVSRWETGMNMPDFDVLIEIADFYEIDIREILEGERAADSDINKKEDLLLIADYTNQEKKNMSGLMRCLFLAGLLAMGAYFALSSVEGYTFIRHFLLGGVTGVLLIGLVYTTKYMVKIREFKLRLLNTMKNRETGEDER